MDSNIANRCLVTVGDELDDEVVLSRQKQQQLQLQQQQNSPQQNMQQPSKVVVESSQIEFFYEKFKQCYPMYKNPRGQCLIVNIYQINGMPPRRWSDRDTDALRQLFEQLLFNVVVYTDSTHDLNCQNFKKIVSDFSKLDEHEEAQCCVVCLMSHGEEGFLTTKEGNKVPLDDIFAMFNNVNCPNLAGKPKLFFIQSCRDDPITGPAEDLGIRLSYTATPTTPSGSSSPSSQLKAGEETDGGGIHHRGRFEQTQSDNNQMIGESLLESSLRTTPSLGSSEERASCESNEQEEENNGASLSQVFYHIPSLCDMIIGFPTQKGFIAYRKPEIGSWYMNAIVNVFSRYAHNTDLCAMLNMVNLLISNEVTNTGKKQMSEYTSKLTKPYFYFFPGLASDPCEAPQLKSSESSRKPINNHQTKPESSSSTIEPCSKRQCFDYFKSSSFSSFDQTDSSSSSAAILSYSPSKNWKHVSRELGLGENFIREFARTHKDQSDAEKMNSLKRFLAANNNSKSRFEELSTVLN